MKRVFTFVAALAALGFLGGCDVKESVQEAGGSKTSATADGYPLKVCVVSGEELGSMGEPVVINHEGKTVKFCCKACLPKFNADPAKYLAKLSAPAAAPHL